MNSKVLLLAVSSVVLSGAISCRSSEPEVEPLVFEPGKFISAERCGACHKDIYSAWNSSLHARAYQDKIFQASFAEVEESAKEEAARMCFKCHAPTALSTDDLEAKQAVTREGVTCDFCHSLREVHLSRPDPFELRVGRVKLGPVKDAASDAHGVEYSLFHTTSRHCAACHQFSNRNGLEILGTYQEWQGYQEKGGTKSCQECHMPVVTANIVDPKVKRVEGAFVNLHEMPGGHSLHQLNKSLRMRIMGLDRTQKGLRIKVKVSNVGAGHSVPTGIPTRKVILTVEVRIGNQKFEDKRVYERVVLGKDGKELRRDSEVFLAGQTATTDTRLKPFEERVEEFLLPVPSDGNAQVQATLTYLYSPHDRKATETRIDFWKERKELATSWEAGK
ncbi:MAG: hypothetical protein EHM61_18205 [Acidobacteria bacterium]|nr:MAG: hypothetical protein EHM61_18205 [Acidobacteriota bacterium]